MVVGIKLHITSLVTVKVPVVGVNVVPFPCEDGNVVDTAGCCLSIL